MKDHGGHCLGVHHPGLLKARQTAERLIGERRIPHFFEADYRVGSQLYNYIVNLITSLCNTPHQTL